MAALTLERLERELADAKATTEFADAANDVLARLNSNNPKIELPGDGRLLSTFAAGVSGST